MTHALPLAERGELVATVRKRVVRHEPTHSNAVPAKPAERTRKEDGRGGRIFVAEDFDIHEARGIIDRHVDVTSSRSSYLAPMVAE
jgi:hypothetical protein